MKSKSPFRQDKCATAWAAWEKPYLKKPGGKKEAAREKGEFYCDNGKIKMRPTGDDDIPMSDAQIKAMKENKSETTFGKKEKSILEK